MFKLLTADASSLCRKFVASNGQVYTWTYKTDGDCEWAVSTSPLNFIGST